MKRALIIESTHKGLTVILYIYIPFYKFTILIHTMECYMAIKKKITPQENINWHKKTFILFC